MTIVCREGEVFDQDYYDDVGDDDDIGEDYDDYVLFFGNWAVLFSTFFQLCDWVDKRSSAVNARFSTQELRARQTDRWIKERCSI